MFFLLCESYADQPLCAAVICVLRFWDIEILNLAVRTTLPTQFFYSILLLRSYESDKLNMLVISVVSLNLYLFRQSTCSTKKWCCNLKTLLFTQSHATVLTSFFLSR
jgi:hypothetical protein